MEQYMKALTVWQPHATLIVHGPKDIENRNWKPPAAVVGHRIAIHAGRTIDLAARKMFEEEYPEFSSLMRGPRGAIIGTAIVKGWIDESDSMWFSGPIGWELEDRRALKKPIPCLGALGLWEVPELVMRQVLEDAA